MPVPAILGALAFMGGLATAKRGSEAKAEAERRKNSRETLEKNVIGPAIESGNLDAFDLHQKTLQQYYPKEDIAVMRSTAEANTLQNKLKRLQALMGVMGGGQQGFGQPQQAQPEGAGMRPQVRNPDGSVSSERSMTFEVDGQFVNVPTMYGGQQVTPEQAIETAKRNNFVDTETGRKLPFYATQQEAVTAAGARSEALGRSMQPQRVPRTRTTMTVDDKGKASFSISQADAAESARSDALLSVHNRIAQSLAKGEPFNMNKIILEEQNRTGEAFKSEDVENIAKTVFGASFEASLNELQRQNRGKGPKDKMTDAAMYSAAAQEAARITGMRGIPQALQESFKPEVPRLPETTAAHLAASGVTPRTAQPPDVQAAIDAQSRQTALQSYLNQSAQLRADIEGRPLQAEDRAKIEPLMAAESIAGRAMEIFSRKPYLVGKGFTDFKTAMRNATNAQMQNVNSGKYVSGALWNSLQAFIGSADPEAVELYKSIAEIQDTVLRGKSGAQINEQEFSRIQGSLFSKWDEPATFAAGIRNFQRIVTETINRRIGLATTPAGEVLRQRGAAGVGGPNFSPGVPGQPGPVGPAPSRLPAGPAGVSAANPSAYPDPRTNVPAGAPGGGVALSQPEVTKILQTLRSSFPKGTKLNESNLAVFLVRNGFATKGPEAQAKAKLLIDVLSQQGGK